MTDFRAIAAASVGPAWAGLDVDAQRSAVAAAKRAWLAARLDPAADTGDFAAWLARQSPVEQDRVLGPLRGAEFRAGALLVRCFTEPPLPAMSLEQLAATLGINPTIPKETDR